MKDILEVVIKNLVDNVDAVSITEKLDAKSICYEVKVAKEDMGKVIGKQGKMLKEIGIQSRSDIEEFLGKKVYLETYVKTIKNWRDREKYLREFGLDEIDFD